MLIDHTSKRWARSLLRLFLALAATLALSACGGRVDEDEDQHRQTPTVDCKSHPEVCK